MYESLRKLRDRRETGEGGFTLVELLIVIVILGILAAIVVLAIGGLSTTSKTAACNADAKTIATAEDAYFASAGLNTNYAPDTATLFSNKLLKSDPNDPTAKFTVAVTGGASPTYKITGTGDCSSATVING
jgi:prepilin-type N-terminal cleavage/methylation domain-containing protein